MTSTASPSRFIGLDVHKASIVRCAVDREQNVLLPPLRLNLGEFEQWIQQCLQPTDAVVLEASSSAWHWYDQLVARTPFVTVANPALVKMIASARVKTDARDALQLARLLAAGLLPPVWVPPAPVRELRGLIAHRARLVRQRTQARNRLHGLLQAHSVMPPTGDPFAAASRAWWEHLTLPRADRLRMRQDLVWLENLAPLIQEVEDELAQLSAAEPWVSQMPFLLQLPGIGLVTAMTLLAAIGDIQRFPTAKKLVGYSGLGARVYASGESCHTGRITKQGRRELRTVMVEAAWSAVEHDPHWKHRFGRLENRIGRHKAIVAVARKLLVAVWHVLSGQCPDRHAEPERVAWKLVRWSKQIGSEGRQGQKTDVFVRMQLSQLPLGQSLRRLARGTQKLNLPPVTYENE